VTLFCWPRYPWTEDTS